MSPPVDTPMPPVGTALPAGVELRHLEARPDHRGRLVEIFRRNWRPDSVPLQWNLVSSERGTLRGVHLHVQNDDYLTIAAGRMIVGLRDLRPRSPTWRHGCMVTLDAAVPATLFVPRGVAHGFFHVAASIHLYGLTRYWNGGDEFGCRWDDPVLNLPWPVEAPILSPRDRDAGTLGAMLQRCGGLL